MEPMSNGGAIIASAIEWDPSLGGGPPLGLGARARGENCLGWARGREEKSAAGLARAGAWEEQCWACVLGGG